LTEHRRGQSSPLVDAFKRELDDSLTNSGASTVPSAQRAAADCLVECGEGSVIQVGICRYILVDLPERVANFIVPGQNLTIVTRSDNGSLFFAPDNNMALGLIQMCVSHSREQQISFKFWMLESEYLRRSGAKEDPVKCTSSPSSSPYEEIID